MILTILIPSLDDTGPSKGAVALANMFYEEFNVFVITLKKNDYKNSGLNNNIKVININSKYWNLFYWIFSYRRFLKKFNRSEKIISISMCFSADFVNIFSSDLCINLSSVRSNIKKDYFYKYGLIGNLISFIHYLILSRFNSVLSMSKSMTMNLKKYVNNIKTIYNFIDEPLLKKYTRSINSDSKIIQLIYLGSLTNRKNPEILIKISNKLLKKNIPFNLKIVGDGYLKRKLIKLIKVNNLNDYVEIHGHVANPYSILIEADIMIIPSFSEGISRASLEALYFGIPCVMRDIDANSELIKDDVNGYLFKNLNDIEDKIYKIYNSTKSVKNHISLIPEEFKYKNIKEKYLEFFKSLN